MRKNKLALFVSIILVVAMVMACAVGCKPKGDGGTTAGGKDGTVSLNNVDRGANFVVLADEKSTDVESKIKVVKTATGEVVTGPIVNTNGKYRVYPPVGYYELGQTYKISIDSSLKFEGYDGNIKNIVFVVTQDRLSNISVKDGLLVFDAKNVYDKSEEYKLDEAGEQQIGGTMKLQTNGVQVNKGDVIIINNADTGLQEAYKVEKNFDVESNTAAVINYSKPQMNEVYNVFEVQETQALEEDSNIEFTYDETLEAIENSDLAKAAFEFFGSKPTFDFNINKVAAENGRLNINVVVGMTIPNVVNVNGTNLADLKISFDCMIGVEAKVNVNMQGEEVDCGVITYVYNSVETNVTISTGYSFDEVTNLTELIEKANQLEEVEAGVAVPMFTWVLPVANGAVSVRYQCDLHFAFNFSGRFGVKVNTDFNYVLGATYSKEDGVATVADVIEGSGFKNVEIKIEGSAKAKIGLANTLALDILAGVVSLGIKAEVGNFNGLYGYASTGNLLEENAAFTGALYFEGGFYYDIDLIVAISVGSIVNLNQKVDIAQDEIVLYTAGQRQLIKSIEANKEINLTAMETPVPEFVAVGYDLKSGEFDTTVNFADTAFDNEDLSIENGIIKIKDAAAVIDTVIPLTYNGITSNLRVKYDGSVVFDKAVYTYDKSGVDRAQDVKIKLSGKMIDGSEVVETEVGSYNPNTSTVTIGYKDVAAMANGTNAVAIVVNGTQFDATIEVKGTVEALGFMFGNDYEIFSAEQIADISAKSNAGIDFAGIRFKLVNDIDMSGMTIAPIKKFTGSLDGNGKTVSGYVVDGVVDNASAFIAKNLGIVKNLTLDGTVNATIAAKTGKDYLVSGAIAKNLGRVENVTVSGDINMTSTSLNAFVTITVMSSICENRGIAEGVSANVSIDAVSKFDVANVRIRIDGSAEYQFKCQNAATSAGAFIKAEII